MQRLRRFAVAALPVLDPWSLSAWTEQRRDAIDTEHMFGFVTGTDIGEVGDKEVEAETNGRFGKRAGAYAALTQTISFEFAPLDNIRVTPAATFDYHAVSGPICPI